MTTSHSSWSADAVLDPFVDPPMPGARPPSAAAVSVEGGESVDPFADPEKGLGVGPRASVASLAPPSPLPRPGHTRLSIASTADVSVSLSAPSYRCVLLTGPCYAAWGGDVS